MRWTIRGSKFEMKSGRIMRLTTPIHPEWRLRTINYTLHTPSRQANACLSLYLYSRTSVWGHVRRPAWRTTHIDESALFSIFRALEIQVFFLVVHSFLTRNRNVSKDHSVFKHSVVRTSVLWLLCSVPSTQFRLFVEHSRYRKRFNIADSDGMTDTLLQLAAVLKTITLSTQLYWLAIIYIQRNKYGILAKSKI